MKSFNRISTDVDNPFYVFRIRFCINRQSRCLREYETPQVPPPPEKGVTLETYPPMGALSFVPEFEDVYQDVA